MKNLDRIFNPRTIAVIGASDDPKSVGHAIMHNLVTSDYDGIVYPVNVKRKSVSSIKAFPSILKVPDQIDLAIIATPAASVPGLIEECGAAGAAGAVVISSGFLEAGKAGEELAAAMLASAKKHNLRIIGPNCLGFIRPKHRLNASFANHMALDGHIALISQSGALCTAILDWSIKNSFGFSHFVSIGSMLDIGFADLIDYFGNDPDVSGIVVYMESLNEARRFLSAARAVSRSKPIIVLKVGRSAEGARAAKSHTGALAGNDDIFSAAFERAGIVRVDTVLELFHTAKALAMQPRPKGKRVAVITNAGGPGVISADGLVKVGGKMAVLAKETVKGLDGCLPPSWSHGNPVDIIGDAGPKRYREATEIVMRDKNTDAILVILTPQAMTEPSNVARELVALSRQSDKTILASWMGGFDVAEGREILEKGNIPVYRTPEDAINCFANLCKYSDNLELLYETPATTPHAFSPDTAANRAIIDRIMASGRENLTEAEAKELLANYEIPVVKYKVVRSASEAAAAARAIGFPVVMKIVSPDILHKTEFGGVSLNVASEEQAADRYNEIMRSIRKHAPEAAIEGVLVEAMMAKRYELLIGCQKDPIFGPAIVFGMGGVAVEVFRDTKVGLPPLNMSLAMHMIEGTRIHKLLKGYRNMPGVDLSAIQFLLYKFAYLVSDFPEIREVDINPFAVDENGGIVLDAKVLLDRRLAGKVLKPYEHMVISPYPKEYITEFKLKGGKIATLRPILPEDEPMEAEMFTHFSAETQRQRFFAPVKEISHQMLVRYTQIDYDREIAIIAELTERGRQVMAGVVRLIGDPYGESAEFAVVVADPWQGKGLGSRFIDYILEIARGRGLKKVWAKFLPDNQVMRKMLEARGFVVAKNGEGLLCAEIKLES